MTKEDNIKLMEIIRQDLNKSYGKNLTTYEYNVEYDSKNIHKEYYHTHLLLGFGVETDLGGVKEHLTKHLEEKVGKSKRVEINHYYGVDDNTGKWYFLKEGVIRLS
jgi:hypothetical protein